MGAVISTRIPLQTGVMTHRCNINNTCTPGGVGRYGDLVGGGGVTWSGERWRLLLFVVVVTT